MNNARMQLGGSGIQTAALAFGGRYTPPGSVLRAYSESYDGTSWVEGPDLATARRQLSSNRSNTGNSAALAFGGNPAPSTGTLTEEFNNSFKVVTAGAWASGGTFNTARHGMGGFGPVSAALICGGNTLAGGSDTPTGVTEEYDGSSWTESGDFNTARYYVSCFGTQTAAVAVGGDSRPPGDGSQTTNEEYDGSSWTAGEAYPAATSQSIGGGTLTAGLSWGGSLPGGVGVSTFEYDGTDWTAGGDLNTAIRWSGGGATQTAGISYGGFTGTAWPVQTEEYNGSSWATAGNMLQARQTYSGGGGGNTQTDTLGAGGYKTPAAFFADTELYNGTSWSTAPNLATARGYGTGGGTSSSGILAGSYAGTSPVGTTEEFTGETSADTASTIDFD